MRPESVYRRHLNRGIHRVKSLQQVDYAFLEVVHVLADQKSCPPSVHFLIMHQTILYIVSHLSAVFQS